MGFNIGPRVLKATGGSIHRSGNYRIHHFTPEIVTDGLVLHLDAGNVNSTRVNDPTTLYDLAGNGNNGALTNGAAYQHYFGGTILLNDGSSTDDGDDILGEDEVFLHSGMQRNVIEIIGSDGTIKNSVAGFAPGAI